MNRKLQKPAKSYELALNTGNRRFCGVECHNGHSGVRYTNNRHCVVCANIRRKATRLRPDNGPKERKRNKAWRDGQRAKVLLGYGGECQCPGGCNVSYPEFLSVDHIGGGGKAHRAQFSTAGSFYKGVVDAGFPKDKFRLLCHNCNMAFGVYGYCPHEKAKMVCQ